MSITHIVSSSWTGGGTTLSQSATLTGGTEMNLSIAATNGWSDHQVAIDFVYATLQDCFILSDKDLTLKFNDSGSPVPSLSIKANKAFLWYSGCGTPNPFTADVTKVYITNGGAVDAALNIRTLVT